MSCTIHGFHDTDIKPVFCVPAFVQASTGCCLLSAVYFSFCLYVSHCSYSHLDFTHLVCVASRYFVKFKPTFSLNTNQRHTNHGSLCPGRTNVLSRPEQDSGVSWCSGPSEPALLKTRHRLPTVKEQEARPKGLSKSVGQSSHDHVDPQPRPLLNLSVYVSFVTSMHTVPYCVVALNLRSQSLF